MGCNFSSGSTETSNATHIPQTQSPSSEVKMSKKEIVSQKNFFKVLIPFPLFKPRYYLIKILSFCPRPGLSFGRSIIYARKVKNLVMSVAGTAFVSILG